jgi:hypothetical protein
LNQQKRSAFVVSPSRADSLRERAEEEEEEEDHDERGFVY